MFGFDAIELARIQFGFTAAFHIIFPAITVGLAAYLVTLEALWLKTANTVYYNLYHFWAKVFAVNFGMGVVSGLVMAFQFGTNWSGFSSFAGSITGALLTYEVMTAFFLEAGFLGVMLLGWKKVGPGLHFLATCMVSLGTISSMSWIISSNSWMQTPQGFEVVNNQVIPIDWLAIIFNPSFLYRLSHMAVGAFLSTALLVGATAAWHLLRGRNTAENKKMFSMAMWFIVIFMPIQVLIGDEHGLNTLKYQPAKIAAIEGHWENRNNDPSPLVLFGWPDMKAEKNKYSIEIPVLGSIILRHSLTEQIPALKDFPAEDRAFVPLPFFGFRIMVGCGVLILILGLVGLYCRYRQTLYTSRPFLRFSLLMAPVGLIGVVAGWFVTETGRQPWVVYGVQRTVEAASTHGVLQVSISLLAFIVVYMTVFTVGYMFMIQIMWKGVVIEEAADHIDTNIPLSPVITKDKKDEELL